MADYTIDVKAKLDIKDLQTQTENEKIIVNVTSTKGSLRTFSNEIRDYFKDSPVKTSLTINGNQIKTFRTDINNWFSQNAVLVKLDANDKSLNNLSNTIEDYFIHNPIKLNLSKETSGLDLQGFTDAINKLYQDQQNAFSQLTKQQIEENKNALEKQASDVLSHYDEIKIQRKNDVLDAEQYYERLKLLAEDENNNKILLETKHATDLRKIREDLVQAKIDLDKERDQKEQEINNQKEQRERESAEKTLQVWKDSIDRAIQEFENTGDLNKFDSAIESIKTFSEQAGVDLKQYFDEASQARDDYINKSLEKTEEMYTKESSGFKNITEEMKNDYINQQSSITQIQTEYSKERLRIEQEEAEKEQNIFQEQIHTRSESISSIFDDYNNVIDTASKILQELDEEFKEKSDFSKYYEQNSEKTTRILNKLFTEDMVNILRHYRRSTYDFEAYNDMFWKKVGLAVEQGVSPEVIQKAQDQWNRIAIQHEKYIKQIEEQDEKARQKKFQEDEKEVKQVVKNQVDIYNAIVNNLKQAYDVGSLKFEQFREKMLETMTDARNLQIVPNDLIDKTSLQLEKITRAYENAQKKREEQQQKALEKQQQEEIKAYEKGVQNNKKYLEDIAKQQQKYNEDLAKGKEKQWNREISNLQDKYKKELISTEEYTSQMERLVSVGFENGYKNADKYSNSLEQVRNKQDEVGESANNLGGKLDNAFNSLMRYFGVTQIFSAVSSSFSKMINEVKNLDAELTEFSKVSDLNAQETERFIDNAYKLGEGVAKTGTEVVQATTLFKKMGHTVDESMDLAKDALMWTNVADGMVSVDEASNMLISTIKAFNFEAKDSTRIIDALNEVSNNYSVSSSHLSNNLSTVSATLAASGVEFEEMIGLMTAGIEIMPDKASKVANGLKTISQRIRQIDGDIAEKLDEFLGTKGIERFDKETGQLKSTYQILSEIADEWKNLSINEKQYLGETMAGKNQITVLNALMTNFSTAIKATETAYNSAGSAAEENARVLDSIQGHVQDFQRAFGELSKDLISSDLFKEVVDFGTRIIKFLDEIIKDKGIQLIDILSGIGLALASWKLSEKIADIAMLITSFGSLGIATAGVAVAITAMGYALADFIQKTEKASNQYQKFIERGTKKQTKDLENLEDGLKKYQDLYQKAMNEPFGEKRNKYFDELAELQIQLHNAGIEIDIINGNHDDTIERLQKEIELEKQKALITAKSSYNEEVRNFNPIQNIIENNKESFGVGTGWLGFLGNEEEQIEEAYGKISNLIISKNKDVVATLEDGSIAIIKGQTKTLGDVLNDNSISIEEKQELLKQAYIDYQNTANYYSEQAKNSITEDAKEFNEEQANTYTVWAGVLDTVIKGLEEEQEKYSDVIDAAISLVKTKLERQGSDLTKYSEEQLNQLKNTIDEFDLEKIDLGKIPEEFKVFADIINDPDLAAGLRKLVEDEITRRQAQQIAELEDAENGVSSGAKEVGLSLSGAIATMSDYASQAEILAQAQEDITNSGQITAETLKKIADAGLEAYLVYDEETKSLVVNTQAFFDNNASLEDNAIAQFVANEQARYAAEVQNILSGSLDNTTDTTNENTTATYQSGEVALDAALKYGEETKAIIEKKKALGELTDEQIKALEVAGKNYKTNLESGVAAIRGYYSAVTSARTATSRGASHSSGSDNSSSRSSSSSSSSADREAQQAQREAEKALREAQQAFKDGFQSLYNELKTYLDLGAITEKEYYDSLEILVDKFYKDREGYEEEYWKYHDEIVKGRKKYLEQEMEDLFKKGETVLKRQLDAEVITYEEYFDSLEQLYKSYYTDKEDFENAMWELEKERYEHQIEEFDKQIKEYEDELSSLFTKGEKLLKHQLEMDELTQEEYLERLEVLYRASITDQEELEDKLLEIKEERYKLEKKKQEEHLKELEKQLEEYYDKVKEMHDEYVKSLEDDAESIDAVISYAIDVLDDEISKLEEEKKALDEANSALEEQIKLQELEENLQKAKNRKIRVYRKGQGFVYEEDTKAVSEAQSAIDEYKKELAHKKEISMIDERIKQLQKYKEAWSNIPKEYKKAQNELLALQRAGSDAQKKILNGDQAFINEFVRQYNTTQDKLSEANKRNIDEINDFIFGTKEGAGLKQKIDQINAEIERVKSIEIKALIKGGEEGSSDSLEEIIDKIENLTSENGPIAKLNKKKIELQAEWKTVNGESQYNTIINNINNIQTELDKIKVKDLNITNWCNNIDSMIKKLQDLTTAANNASNAGIDVSNIGNSTYNPSSGNTDGGNGGFKVGDLVTLPDSDIPYTPFRGKKFKIVQFENQDMTYNPKGSYAAVLVEGGKDGEITYRVPVSHLNASSSGENPSDNHSSGQPYSEPVKDTNGKIVGYNWYNPDGSFLYYEAAHASGTLGTTTKTFRVNENGLEAMVTPEGTVISAPSTGYGVIKNEYTERLTDFASDPMGFLSKAFSGYSGTYKNNSSTNETININGNLTLPNVTNGESFVDSIRNLALQYTTRRK